jgi:hypothetical protein
MAASLERKVPWSSLTALFLLNAMLSMTNWWPTPWVKFDLRIAPEFVFVTCFIVLAVKLQRPPNGKGLSLLTLIYLGLVLGRYLDTTAPALFGRAVNLYWDGLQIPRLLWVLAGKHHPGWTLLAILTLVVSFWLAYKALNWALAHVVGEVAPFILARRSAQLLTLVLLSCSIANLFGVKATWPLISRPVLPTYFAQASILLESMAERRGESTLPASPRFDSDLKRLNGSDFKLFFLESYGAINFDHADLRKALRPEYQSLQKQLTAGSWSVASAFITSSTFGGGTDLAHMALLSGVDTRDPRRHDVLLTSQRPTLVSQFRSRGFETFGFYPGLDWDWPEGTFFNYEHLIDGRRLMYGGPKLGYWKIPDQFAVARFLQLFPVHSESKPRFEFFASSTSHFPFSPVPPYVSDWAKVLGSEPFDRTEVSRLQNSRTDWLNMLPSYAGMVAYNLKWLTGYFQQTHSRDFVMLVLGDHQPASAVTGEGASWDVPVHIISSRPDLIDRFVAAGFTKGFDADRQALGTLSELTGVLLDVLDSRRTLSELRFQRLKPP